jgi:hypothetical protein
MKEDIHSYCKVIAMLAEVFLDEIASRLSFRLPELIEIMRSDITSVS